jgi:diphosphomevalonate decarboxylase
MYKDKKIRHFCMINTATAIAHPNIAFIKYWGNKHTELRIPANSSLSMNLTGLVTHTRVTFDPARTRDVLTINQAPASVEGMARAKQVLDLVRRMAGLECFAEVASENNFPTGAGIASSASAFAALSLAASSAAGMQLSEQELSRLARRGSGSACRSVPSGFVEWQAGIDDESSYAFSIANPEHWDLVDCIAVVSEMHKPTTSSEGHKLADTSVLQAARLADTPARMDVCRQAIMERDFDKLAEVIELDCNLMHAVMMTSKPALMYWQPVTLAVIHAVHSWRKAGIPVCYTIDAGPNVHVLSLAGFANQVSQMLSQIPGVEDVLTAKPGGPAYLEQ